VINLVKIERGELPISLSTLARTAKPTSQPMLKPLEGGTPTPTHYYAYHRHYQHNQEERGGGRWGGGCHRAE